MNKLYDYAVMRTLYFYEAYVLPKHSSRVGLLELKKQEFRTRKQLLNPVLKTQLLESASDDERARLKQLEARSSFNNINSFNITMDRHNDLYGFRYSNFADLHNLNHSPLNYAHDPDWSVKIYYPRLKIKRVLLILTALGLWVYWKTIRVEKFDHLKRVEQRAMQNKEIEQFVNKKVSYVLFEKDDSEYQQNSKAYQILWFDSKMKNYELMLSFIMKKRVVRAVIDPILVVDQPAHMTGVLQIWEKQKPAGLEPKVLLSRPLSDQEQLVRSFSKSEDVLDLELRKGFYYVVNPDGLIIDCAKIYSFIHEDNIYQRIMARITQDVDLRTQK